MKYPIDRFTTEVKRQLDVLDRRLADNRYLAGDAYSIADIGTWPWYGALAKGRLYDAGQFLQVENYEHVQRWADEIDARPAVQRGRMVNCFWGAPLVRPNTSLSTSERGDIGRRMSLYLSQMGYS